MKIIGIVIASFVVIAGASVGIYALRGGFKEVKIDIMKLYFDAEVENTDETEFMVSETLTKQTIYTLTDVTTKIDFEPFDSTHKDLTVKITGVEGILDNEEELKQGIKAGEEFTLKLRKDSQGNNYGGVVNLTATSPNGIAQVTITLVVDVPIPDNSIYFSGDTNNRVTANGKAFTLAKNNVSSHIYLKSELYNAFYLPVSENNFATVTGNLKSTKISYEYYGLDGKPLEDGLFRKEYTFDDLEIVRVYDNNTHTYAYYYKIPVVPKESGTIKFTAKTHRSYTIQKEFEDNGFDNLATVLANAELSNQHATEAAAMRRAFTNFINKYIEYFDDTEESYLFFRNCINKNGEVELSAAQALSALDYVFVTCTATVDVTAVNLNQITSLVEAEESYHVFDTVDFSKKAGLEIDNRIARTIYDEFDLKITLNGENGEVIEGTPDEESTLFDTLDMGAYIYLDAASVESEGGEGGEGGEEGEGETFALDPNAPYDDVIPVYGFDEGRPITPYIAETLTISEQEDYKTEDGEYIVIGYLYKIKAAMDSNKFMQISPTTVEGEACWSVNFDVPLAKVVGETAVKKALFFRFSVNGVNIKTSARIDRETFTRIYIDFTEYEYASSTSSQLSLQSVTESGTPTSIKTNMALNNSLDNADAYALNTQAIQIDTASDTILNYNGPYSDGVKEVREVEYKSVMYFAEASSNAIGDQGAKQIVTIGKYNFSSMTGVPYLFTAEENLVGERIPTYNIVDGAKQYYIQTVNASQNDEGGLKKPVKIFAVVYLSDKDGNPIDLSGKKITINEADAEEPTMLYVIAMSDISTSNMTNLVIHNFVDNVNFYTTMAAPITLCKDSEDLTLGITYDTNEWVKRNSVTSFVYTDGATKVTLNDKDLTEYNNFLRLKLLRNKDFQLYLTNFELSSTGEILDTTNETTFRVVDIDGTVYDERPFIVNTKDNKQIALNNLCSNFTSNYGLSSIDNVSVDSSRINYKKSDAGDYEYISFIIKANSEALTNANYSLYLVSKNNSTPYSNDAAKYRASLTVNKIDIYDVQLTAVKQQNTLYASYLARNDYTSSENRGKIQFNELSQDGSQKTPYIPMEIGDIQYTVSTNLIRSTLEDPQAINTDIVDASQAVYDKPDTGGEGGATPPVTSDGVGEDIEDYIEYYSQSGLNVTKGYATVTKFARLKTDLVYELINYTNLADPSGDEKKLSFIIGTSVYQDFDVSNGGAIYSIGGQSFKDGEFPVVGSYKNKDARILYPANTYFPVVTTGGKNYMLAFGEKFEIYKNTQNYSVFRKESVTTSISEVAVDIVSSFEVDGIAGTYTSNKYITNSTDLFELTMGEDHTTRYFEDENGVYKYNSGSAKYEIAEEGYLGTKYTPQDFEGVTAYLLINFGFIPLNPDESGKLKYELEISKVLTFNLVQRDLNFTFYVGKEDETLIENSTANRLQVPAGEAEGIDIQLNPNGELFPSITADDTNVFSHITIESSIDGVTVVQDTARNINIKTTKNFGSAANQSFFIKYLFKGKIETHEFFIEVTPNYSIKFNGERCNGTETASSYVFNVDAYGINSMDDIYSDGQLQADNAGKSKIYDLSSILGLEEGAESGLFKGSVGFDKYKLELIEPTNAKNVAFSSSDRKLTVGESLVMSGKEYVEFKITLEIEEDNLEVLTKTLRININPTYMVSFSGLADTSATANKVFNGVELFGDYIVAKGYNMDSGDYSLAGRNSNGAAIVYEDLFDIQANGEDVVDGIIDIYGERPPFKEDTVVELSIAFGGVTGVTKYLTIHGIELYYSRLGDVVGESYEADKKHLELGSDIVIDLVEGQSMSIANYFAFYTAGKTKLSVVLVDGDDSIYESQSITASEGEELIYDIYFALSQGGQYIYKTNTSYMLTIRTVKAFVSTEGDFTATEFDDTIHIDEKKLNSNVNISVVAGTAVKLDDYLAIFSYSTEDSEYTKVPTYVYVDGTYVNTVQLDAAGTVSYNIYFREVIEGSDPVEYKYNPISYTITITVTEIVSE